MSFITTNDPVTLRRSRKSRRRIGRKESGRFLAGFPTPAGCCSPFVTEPLGLAPLLCTRIPLERQETRGNTFNEWKAFIIIYYVLNAHDTSALGRAGRVVFGIRVRLAVPRAFFLRDNDDGHSLQVFLPLPLMVVFNRVKTNVYGICIVIFFRYRRCLWNFDDRFSFVVQPRISPYTVMGRPEHDEIFTRATSARRPTNSGGQKPSTFS